MWVHRFGFRGLQFQQLSKLTVRNYRYQRQQYHFKTIQRPVVYGFLGWLFGTSVDYDAVRKDIKTLLDDYNYDDGSYGPVLVRLAWHASGTYDKKDNTGGSDGSTMRFSSEANDGANAGLDVARKILDKVKEKHPDISHADLWILASYVALEEMGGPHIEFKPGRIDAKDDKVCPTNGRLPDASKGAQHIRDVFYRMGFDDQEIVALVGGGHALGRAHKSRSGYDGPWTRAPTTFANEFFKELFDEEWQPRKGSTVLQFEDKKTQNLMMLPTDIALKSDPEFRKWSDIYYKDNDRFLKDFANAFKKLTELGFGNKK